MSIRVLKAKAQSRRLVSEKNSAAKMPVNLYYSPNKGLCCPTNPHEPNPSGGIYIPKKPAPQKSYGNYNRQAMLGLTGLASRVVSLKDSQTNNPLAHAEMNTFKRMPKFSQSQYLKNKGNCDIREDKCNPKKPKCKNDNCGKTKISITKSVGFLSEGEYLKQKIIKRITPKDHNNVCPDKCKYELPLAKPGLGRLTC